MADLTAAARGIWWLVLLRGILAILFGLFALFAPGTALLALVFVFGAYAIVRDSIGADVQDVYYRLKTTERISFERIVTSLDHAWYAHVA
jgi:hypothetical protein